MSEVILNAVREEFGLTAEEMSTKSGRRQAMRVVEGKQVAAFLLWKYSNLLRVSRKEIASQLGYEFKYNVTAAIKRTKKIAEGNKAFKERLTKIENEILRS